ncbi:MAG TPA: tripartite tricarboxylate transporter substrate-binding protein [Ramlibacter sp.]|nr:tripartite tricarboxylate transporter substrate-binding protein [Ramlibacter sp.]
MFRRSVLKALGGLAAVRTIGAAQAQTDVKKIIVGFAAGSATDVLARTIAEKMKGQYGSSIVVENRVGASGQVAVSALKAAPPDGATMLLSPMAMLSLYPYIIPKLAYDPLADVVPVGNCATLDIAIAVGADVPAEVDTLPKFIDWCKAHPAKATFATGATGSKMHFGGIQLGLASGLKLTHVGYSNGANALSDLVGGTVPAYVGVIATIVPFLPRVRVLATMGSQRSRFLPEVPTLAELGYKNLVVNETVGMYLPARTPQEHVQRLHAAMVKALNARETTAALATLGMEATPSTPAELSSRMKTELGQWGAVVKTSGFKQDS